MLTAVKRAEISGLYTARPSKSDSHRALICAALADGFSHISPIAASKDIEATINALQALECNIKLSGEIALIQGISGTPHGNVRIFCGESGSTLRFLLPIVAAFGIEAVFTGTGKLPQRPLSIYHDIFKCKGVELCRLEDDELPLKISGKLEAGRFSLKGNVSSQFITGLMFALPLLQGDSEIIITSKLESKPYVDMTISTLNEFGIKVDETDEGYYISGGQSYTPCTYHIDGDYSNSAFFAVAGLLGDGISIAGLNALSKQGDKEIFDIIKRFGGIVTVEEDIIKISKGKLSGISIDAEQIPDLVPILAVLGACAEGETKIYGAHRLKLKESDRLTAITEALAALGASISCDNESITVYGGTMLHGGVASSCNDHRIAMSIAIAALYSDGEIIIDGSEAVEKSYPNFFEDYNKLGGCANVKLG